MARSYIEVVLLSLMIGVDAIAQAVNDVAQNDGVKETMYPGLKGLNANLIR